MGQVPSHPLPLLLIGRGRLAQHLLHYFDLLNVTCRHWHRGLSTDDPSLQQAVLKPHRVLLAISDPALPEWAERPWPRGTVVVHFSGSARVENVVGLHPLMAFTPAANYSVEVYKSIPFVGTRGEPSLGEVLPELPNSFYPIPAESRVLYHALCAAGGNLTTWIWQQVLRLAQTHCHLPEEVFHPYMTQLQKNLVADSTGALTGPVARGDWTTVEAHLLSLAGTGLQKSYETFADAMARPLEPIPKLRALRGRAKVTRTRSEEDS